MILNLQELFPSIKGTTNKLSVGNYRPVSILNVVSKILEKVVYYQVEAYFKDKDLLYKFQSGFRSGFSTDTCLIHLTDFIRYENDKGNVVGMVLLDLQKVFDTVDHSILLMKLQASGLSIDVLNWFKSYLSDRQQLYCRCLWYLFFQFQNNMWCSSGLNPWTPSLFNLCK